MFPIESRMGVAGDNCHFPCVFLQPSAKISSEPSDLEEIVKINVPNAFIL